MKLSRLLNFATLLSLISPAASGQHPTLLPQPEEIRYGTGSLPLRGVSIRFASAPTEEDRFAANMLAAGLREALGVAVPIQDGTSGRYASHLSITLRRTGAIDPLPLPGEVPGPDGRESYQISVMPRGAEISGRSTAGVYYGVKTLLQMVEGAGDTARLPEATVHDWPALAYRATLMDVGSEGPMSTFEEVKKQIDFLARWKANQFFLYSEGNIELKGYPLLNPQARFTQEQVREMVRYARARHIDVIPAIEMYGHLHDLFRIEKYSELADTPHGGEFNPDNPKVKAVLEDWAAQMADLFPSPFVDVGFDETWGIQKAASHGTPSSTASEPVRLFVKQLATVASLFQGHGKTVMAYADIIVKVPGILPQLPKGLIALPWWYEPSPDPEYKRWLSPLISNHVPHLVTSGVSSWDEIAPDFSMSFENIDTLLSAGRKSHSLGLLNTLWTDDGQMLMEMSWPGMAYGAIAAWQSTPMNRGDFFSKYSDLVYPKAAAAHMAKAFTDLDEAESSLQKAIGQETGVEMWNDPFRPAMLAQLRQHRTDLRRARLEAESAQEHFYAAQALRNSPEPMHLQTDLVGAKIIDLVGLKFLYALEMADIWDRLGRNPTRETLLDSIEQGLSNETHSRTMDLMDGFSELKESYKQAWMEQYTRYRMATALRRWDAEYEFWRRTQKDIESVRRNFKTGDTLPGLEDLSCSCHSGTAAERGATP